MISRRRPSRSLRLALVCPTVLEDEHLEVAEGFASRILDLEPSAPMPRWLARVLGEGGYTLPDEVWEAFVAEARPERAARFEAARAEPLDRQIDAQERSLRWLDFAERTARGHSLSGVAALDADGVAPQPAYLAERGSEPRPFDVDPERIRGWIAEARVELEAGRPGYALQLGRDLHWAEPEGLEREARELLTAAYRALGRDALATIVEVHHPHRDLRSVDVYLRG